MWPGKSIQRSGEEDWEVPVGLKVASLTTIDGAVPCLGSDP